ncbi:ATP-dependent RNA helicase HrpA [Orrella sp. 11846]|uniref:ATP-dependent RNA helicase HrpA n=1 Tax=Orrella sp. 11846 TaxID=3409913 RepID=UPI003B5BB936
MIEKDSHISDHQLPPITFDPALPVSANREVIEAAIRDHPVVIVSGETGSGKTTQLPKICLAMGRGRTAMIGHTQPRRLAATSVARRIAQELETPLGDWVGYQIRFQDRSAKSTAIKLMTDGILLAQTQRDPLLKRYDTLIIDEAHERSLNIDFLLGYVHQLLKRRDDLKVIITSATLDAEQFARHFCDRDGRPAPIIEVSGRLYPVEILYRPLDGQDQVGGREGDLDEDSEDGSAQSQVRELSDAIVDAVDECQAMGQGDILVFLPGEREIREATTALQDHADRGVQILPLFARLSQNEQEAIFRPKTGARRVILATNVAETSLTVPGIRYVIDSGLARVKRYSWRQKVEQLLVEPVSQAAANQRAGRCGREGPGVCIRLYDEQDFERRREFTDPEILRSSLASVILRMKSLRFDDIEHFAFVDAPTGRAIADGYQSLQELGALNERNQLTRTGQTLARLPLDPRVGRMLLSAVDQQCLSEMLIIASALAVQDPRERPVEAREAAMQAHAPFKDTQSEFLSWLKLWQWDRAQLAQSLSRRAMSNLLKKNFLSANRMREWRDVHEQLVLLAKERRWRLNQSEATYEQLHRALLSGLLGHVGLKADESPPHYRGVRDLRFWVHPGSTLRRKAGKWVVAAELVQTSRLYARCVANIEPQWIEAASTHLLKKSWAEPTWDRKRGQVIAFESATLYGLPLYSGRRVHYGPIDAQAAREVFIREALVQGLLTNPIVSRGRRRDDYAFLTHNIRLVREIEQLEHRSRRPDILVDESRIEAFYEKRLPPDIHQAVTFRQWFKGLSSEEAASWLLKRDDLMVHDATEITVDVFPKHVMHDGTRLRLEYHFEPGSPRDGVTLVVPLMLLNQLDAIRWEWLVPGMLKEKVEALVRSLPQRIRRHCVPVPAYAETFHKVWFDRLDEPNVSLLQALAQDIRTRFKVDVRESDFKPETLAPHLLMQFKILDQDGRFLNADRDLNLIRSKLGVQAQETFQKLTAQAEPVDQQLPTEDLVDWSFGVLPEMMEIRRGRRSVVGYPALVDHQTVCRIELFDDLFSAQRAHRLGVLRLLRLTLRDRVKYLEKNTPHALKLGVLFMPMGAWADLHTQLIDAALMHAAFEDGVPDGPESFEKARQKASQNMVSVMQTMSDLVLRVLETAQNVRQTLTEIQSFVEASQDLQTQLQALLADQFVRDTPYERLVHFPRYLQAMVIRMEGLRNQPRRDEQLMDDLSSLEARYAKARTVPQDLNDKARQALEDFGWQLQELRVALFAQQLRTPSPVSVKRLQKAWDALKLQGIV